LQLRQPIGFDSHYLLPWSSFPSDNAVLFFALATGVFLVGRKAGILLYLHAVVVVALPRLYLGIHYSSDLLAGALLGWALAYTAKWDGLRLAVTRPAFQLEEVSPGLFYGGLFLLSFETALLYTHVLNAAVRVLQFLRPLLHHAG
jgi:undecaprenyl-diphosphatase